MFLGVNNMNFDIMKYMIAFGSLFIGSVMSQDHDVMGTHNDMDQHTFRHITNSISDKINKIAADYNLSNQEIEFARKCSAFKIPPREGVRNPETFEKNRTFIDVLLLKAVFNDWNTFNEMSNRVERLISDEYESHTGTRRRIVNKPNYAREFAGIFRHYTNYIRDNHIVPDGRILNRFYSLLEKSTTAEFCYYRHEDNMIHQINGVDNAVLMTNTNHDVNRKIPTSFRSL